MDLESKELFEILVRENTRGLMTFLRASGCDATLADDVWQETMLVAWRRLDDFDRSKPFAPWLRGIAARVLLAHRRKNSNFRLHEQESLEYLSERMQAVHCLMGDTLDEKLDALRDCVGRLTQSDRESIELRYRDELLPQAISQQLGIGLETIKKRLQRAKQRLQICLESKLQSAVTLENG